jgi:DNA-binding GntR family transcriptional regulator
LPRVTATSTASSLATLDTLSDQVHRRLRTLLMAGALAPGQKLTLRGLADRFGTSVMPVRDAVRRLTAAGGLVVQANRTIRVNAPSSSAFAEMIRIRCALEGLATEVSCSELSFSQVHRLRKLVQRYEILGKRPHPNPTLLARANRDLHFSVYRAARMPQLLALIEGLWIQVGPVLSMIMRQTSHGLNRRDAIDHHTRLIESLQQGDAVRARQAVVADIRQTGTLILRSGFLDALNEEPMQSRRPVRRVTHRL